MGEAIERARWLIVAAIVALGFALRVAAAQGGLWLDEAWSAVMAHEAATPVGVFANINHDNNHHLNTLWLQFVGLDAAPLLQRALSIVSGTATIWVVARIGARRNAATAIFAALLFAASPILVTYGSEARGYATMLLAAMIAMDAVDRCLDDPRSGFPALPLALAAFLGLLAHVTMVFALAGLGVWTIWTWRRHRSDLFSWLAGLWGPATMASAVAFALIFIPAWRAGGMAFGAADAFTLANLAAGLWQGIEHGLGSGYALIALAVAALFVGVPIGRLATGGYALCMAAPAFVMLAHFPNVGVARLYLISVAGLLLLVALMLGNAHARGQRSVATGTSAALVILMGIGCATLVADRRADPARSLTAIAGRAPGGADVAIDHPRSEAILRAAAASAGYPLIVRQTCPAPRFLFVERDGADSFPPAPQHCNAGYREIAGDTVQGLSGTQWKLYERSAR